MSVPMKVNVFFAFFPYGGNGGISSEHPSIRTWFARTVQACQRDERVGQIFDRDFSDTPITMTRNAAVREAKMVGADFLVMCDSDQHPDRHLGLPGARPFWESSFEFAYERRRKDLVTIVGAPYCGPPPTENVYVFRWSRWETDSATPDFRLEQYGREETVALSGIRECAALPTGLILFDLNAFDLVKPPYFYYEYTDEYETEKASTEDVTATRDLSIVCQERHGYSPVFCNWDAWAGHWKPKCVERPRLVTVDMINDKYRDAVLSKRDSRDRLADVEPGPLLKAALRAQASQTPAQSAPNGKISVPLR